MRARRARAGDLPHHESDGYLVRDAHRAFQRLLERRIAPHGVTRGQWYFLRVLWTEDGLSQRELSARVGMMEPTTVIALRSMEKAGLIRRVRSTDDRRVTHVRLTPKAKRMRDGLLKLARSINAQADEGISPRRHRGLPPRHHADDRQSRQGRVVAPGAGMAQSEIDAIRALLGSKPRPVGWAERRQRLDEVGSVWPVAADIALQAVNVGGVPGECSIVPGSDPARALLFFHGGGYCSGSILSHRRMVTEAGRAARRSHARRRLSARARASVPRRL